MSNHIPSRVSPERAAGPEAVPQLSAEKQKAVDALRTLLLRGVSAGTGSVQDAWSDIMEETRTNKPQERVTDLYDQLIAHPDLHSLASGGNTVELVLFGSVATTQADKSLRIHELVSIAASAERTGVQRGESRYAEEVYGRIQALPADDALRNPLNWYDSGGDTSIAAAHYDRLFGARGLMADKANPDRSMPAEEVVFGTVATTPDLKHERMKLYASQMLEVRDINMATENGLESLTEQGFLDEATNAMDNILDEWEYADGAGTTKMVVQALAVCWMLHTLFTKGISGIVESPVYSAISIGAGLFSVVDFVRIGSDGRIDVFDELKLTSNLDDINNPDIVQTMKRLGLERESEARGILMLGQADLGTMYGMYKETYATDNPDDQQIDIRALTGERPTRTVTDEDAYGIADHVFNTYGTQFFLFATGRMPENTHERMLGAQLFVEYHTDGGNANMSLMRAITSQESTAKTREEFKNRILTKEGGLPRFLETAGNILGGIVTLDGGRIAGALTENMQWALETLGLEANVDGTINAAAEQLSRMYDKLDIEARKRFDQSIVWMKSQHSAFAAAPEAYLRAGRDGAVRFVMDGAAGTGGVVTEYVWQPGKAMFEVFIKEPGVAAVDMAKGYFLDPSGGGYPVLHTPVLPWSYDAGAGTWRKVSVRNVTQGSVELVIGANIYALQSGEWVLRNVSQGIEIASANVPGVVQALIESAKQTNDIYEAESLLDLWAVHFIPWALKNQDQIALLLPGGGREFSSIYRANEVLVDLFVQSLQERERVVASGRTFKGPTAESYWDAMLATSPATTWSIQGP